MAVVAVATGALASPVGVRRDQKEPGPGQRRAGEPLPEYRDRAGLTQAALADAIGVTRKTINTVERGHYVPSTVLALRLAVALDATVEALFELP